jgi:flagellar protein FlaI
MFEHIEKLAEVELEISDLKEKLEELLLLERLRKGDLSKKNYMEEVKASYAEGSISRGTYEHLMLVAKKKGLHNKKTLDREAAKAFVEAYNILSRAKKALGLEAEYLELEEKGSPIESLKKAIIKAEEKPKPVRGGKTWKAVLKSIFIKSEKEGAPESKEGGPIKITGIAKIIESINKIKSMFSPSAPVEEEFEERFYVPVFATDTGLAEKQTKRELAEKKMFERIKKENIVALKEKLFAEGEKAEPLIKASGLITLIPGYAYAKIVKEKNGKKVYYVIEPDLSEDELKKIELIKAELIEVLTIEELTKEKMFAKVEEIIRKRGYTFTRQGRHKLMYYLSRDLLGLERLEPLMHDNMIEDIECDGVGIPVYIIHKKEGHMPTNIIFPTTESLEDFIIKMAQLAKTYVSYASPLLDAVLPDGSRVNAVLTSSVSTRGPSFTIRLFPEKPLPPTVLIANGTADARIMAYLWTVLEFKKSILITGPTASGKTTLLNAIAMFIPQSQRIVSIEDTRELNLKHENWLPQVARPGFGPPDSSGKRFGEVDLMTLIKESFRQRPDYLIVGEVRGKETFILFQGMASGHCCLATMHARSVTDVVSRLITPPINLFPSLLESVDIIINLGFSGEEGTKRRIRCVAEVQRYNMKEQRLEYVDILAKSSLAAEAGGVRIEDLHGMFPLTGRSILLRKISDENDIPLAELEKRIEKRAQFLQKLTEEKVFDHKDFTDRIEGYRNAEKVLVKKTVRSGR